MKVLIVGAGTMGVGIIALFLAGGWSVEVVTRSSATLERLPGEVSQALRDMGKAPDVSALVGRLVLAEAPWSEIDLVLETVTESLALKQSLFADFERLARPDVPLASNSSSYPISRIAAGLTTPHRMLGLHFFMPANLIPLVEVVRSAQTDVALAERVGELMRNLGKRPVQVKRDVVGFLANRMQDALMREALYLIDQGIATPEDVDATVRLSFGFRYAAAGPITQKEHSGWDTTCAGSQSIWPDLCNASSPPPVLLRLVQEGHLGFKTGQGFFPWDQAAIARETARYDRALHRCLEIFRDEGLL